MGGWKALTGLMLDKSGEPLLFEFQSEEVQGHSLFCKKPFLAIWLTKDNEIINWELIETTKAFRPKKPARFLLEVPVNNKNQEFVDNFMKK